MIKKDDFYKALVLVSVTYPTFVVPKNQDAVNMWYELFKNSDWLLFQEALKVHFTAGTFAPVPADIFKQMEKIASRINPDNSLTAEEAWAIVIRAISYYGQYNAEKAMESFPVRVQKALQIFGGFVNLCQSDNIVADRAHFLRTYGTYSDRDKEERLLPESTRNLILELGGAIGNMPGAVKMLSGNIEESDRIMRRLKKERDDYYDDLPQGDDMY